MNTVTVSPKYQIVIPKEIRLNFDIKPGQKLQFIQVGEKMMLLPLRDIKEAKGMLKGMNTNFEREADRI